jgi:hypothetical protein
MTPLVYVARAVDWRPTPEFKQVGHDLAELLAAAGYYPVDPVETPFPGVDVTFKQGKPQGVNRVNSDLAWLRRSDALVVDMSITSWQYVGCICELVYAYKWDIPSVVITGASPIGERMWLKYHATRIVHDAVGAVDALRNLKVGPGPFAPPA